MGLEEAKWLKNWFQKAGLGELSGLKTGFKKKMVWGGAKWLKNFVPSLFKFQFVQIPALSCRDSGRAERVIFTGFLKAASRAQAEDLKFGILKTSSANLKIIKTRNLKTQRPHSPKTSKPV